MIEQQKAVGIDLPNNGEQGREAFFPIFSVGLGVWRKRKTKTLGSLMDFPDFADSSDQLLQKKQWLVIEASICIRENFVYRRKFGEINTFKDTL